MENVISVLIVDDQQIITQGLTSLLAFQEELEVVGTASDNFIAEDFVRNHQVDVVLMDFNMPEVDGIQCTKNLLAINPNLKILILTSYDDVGLVRESIHHGAMGFLLKNIDKDELITAIKTVYMNKQYLGISIQGLVINSFLEHQKVEWSPNNPAQGNGDQFLYTKREIEVLREIAKGKTSQQIASELFISLNTVETHRKNILSKSEAKNMTELINFANKSGII
ncbi:MAG: response regulator transcription factor [Saprospiraceae bacterium]|nr:response regulator transcription factor [Saprospiraceae bacterium]